MLCGMCKRIGGTYREFVRAIGGTLQRSEINSLALLVSPNILDQFGIFDEGISVVLNVRNGIETIYFFFRNRILTMPSQKDFYHMRSKLEIGVVGDILITFIDIIVTNPGQVFIRGSNIEISACEVTFILVAYIKSVVVPGVIASHKEETVVHFSRVCQHSGRVVRFVIIGHTVSRAEVIEILVGVVIVATPPALGETMLYVHPCRTSAWQGEVTFGVGIHIPYGLIGASVCSCKPSPSTGFSVSFVPDVFARFGVNLLRRVKFSAVRNSFASLNDLTKSSFKFGVLFAVNSIVVALWHLFCGERENKEQADA